jgi:broad specificity phosphatase PhoE
MTKVPNAMQNNNVMPAISEGTTAFSHIPEHGFSLFLQNRTKTIHFIRHAEGNHNQANKEYGDDTPCIYSTDGAWKHQDARLTEKGIRQCVEARETLLNNVNPELIVVSPFTRTLQTAHIMFAGKGYPFLVHHLCQERWGRYTCDKKRSKTEIVNDMLPIYAATDDKIDFDSFGFISEHDELWTKKREPDDDCTGRGIAMMQWLASRPENNIAVVTHSSWLKHLFRAFGESIHEKDKKALHRLAGNAEVRSVCLALHKGFYPEGKWIGDTNIFVPDHISFRRGRWAPNNDTISKMHSAVRDGELKCTTY